MPDELARLLQAHPDSRHPRVTIRIREIDFAANEDVPIIRAPSRENQDGKDNDLNDCKSDTSHPAVLIEIRNSRTENGGRAAKAFGVGPGLVPVLV